MAKFESAIELKAIVDQMFSGKLCEMEMEDYYWVENQLDGELEPAMDSHEMDNIHVAAVLLDEVIRFYYGRQDEMYHVDVYLDQIFHRVSVDDDRIDIDLPLDSNRSMSDSKSISFIQK